MFPTLTISYSEFKKTLDELSERAEKIINTNVSSENDLIRFKADSEQWRTDCLKSIDDSFFEFNNWFVRQFIAGSDGFSIPGNFKRPWQDEINLERLKMRNRRTNLITNLNLVGACDIIRSKDIDKDIRASYSVRQKSDFIVQKLYDLNDDLYYPITILVQGNGLLLRNKSEAIELAKRLEDDGFIHTIGGAGSEISGKITVKGSIYVEEKLQKHSENYNDIVDDPGFLNRAIENIKEELNKLGLGQEIIFNEIDELKNLRSKLSNKNFCQIIKGKLIDLALAKAVENDTIGFIYHELTGHALKLVN